MREVVVCGYNSGFVRGESVKELMSPIKLKRLFWGTFVGSCQQNRLAHRLYERNERY